MLQGTLKRTLLCCLLGASLGAQAKIDEIHFLIPGGAGGGWDNTARGTGEALTKSGLITTASYQNISAGGGAKAIAHLIETSAQSDKTLMVNSTPIIVKSLSKELPQSFRDLTPVAAIIADYQALAVPLDSPYQSWPQLLAAYQENPAKVKIAGGSARGSLDHLVAAMTFKNAGAMPASCATWPMTPAAAPWRRCWQEKPRYSPPALARRWRRSSRARCGSSA